MKSLLKNAREQKGLKTRELAQLSGIDQALISKFESGARKPTKDQIVKLVKPGELLGQRSTISEEPANLSLLPPI